MSVIVRGGPKKGFLVVWILGLRSWNQSLKCSARPRQSLKGSARPRPAPPPTCLMGIARYPSRVAGGAGQASGCCTAHTGRQSTAASHLGTRSGAGTGTWSGEAPGRLAGAGERAGDGGSPRRRAGEADSRGRYGETLCGRREGIFSFSPVLGRRDRSGIAEEGGAFRTHGSGLVSSVSVNHVSQRSLIFNIALQYTSQIHFSSSVFRLPHKSSISSRRVF